MLISFIIFCIFLVCLSYFKVWKVVLDNVVFSLLMLCEDYLTRPILMFFLVVWLLFVVFWPHVSITLS